MSISLTFFNGRVCILNNNRIDSHLLRSFSALKAPFSPQVPLMAADLRPHKGPEEPWGDGMGSPGMPDRTLARGRGVGIPGRVVKAGVGNPPPNVEKVCRGRKQNHGVYVCIFLYLHVFLLLHQWQVPIVTPPPTPNHTVIIYTMIIYSKAMVRVGPGRASQAEFQCEDSNQICPQGLRSGRCHTYPKMLKGILDGLKT